MNQGEVQLSEQKLDILRVLDDEQLAADADVVLAEVAEGHGLVDIVFAVGLQGLFDQTHHFVEVVIDSCAQSKIRGHSIWLDDSNPDRSVTSECQADGELRVS